jgi:sodium/bile acid cotransporter 7
VTQTNSLTAIRRVLARVDRYLILLVMTVGLASLFPASGIGRAVLDIVTYAAVAILFFLYGARLAPAAIWAGLSNWRLQALVMAGTFLLFPLIGIVVVRLFSGVIPSELAFGLLFLCLLPSTVQSSIAFTSIARGNVPAALCSASISNLIGVLLTPLLAGLLLPAQGSGISGDAIEKLVIQIFLPFCLGQAARPFIGQWLSAHRTLTMVVDRGSILLVVYAAFSAGVLAGIWTQLSIGSLLLVAGLDLGILVAVILSMRGASRLMGFPIEDEISIIFCGSKKSMASGIPIATALFSAHAVSLIVLPLMLFHQIQLMVCAIMARRYSERREVPSFNMDDRRGLV